MVWHLLEAGNGVACAEEGSRSQSGSQEGSYVDLSLNNQLSAKSWHLSLSLQGSKNLLLVHLVGTIIVLSVHFTTDINPWTIDHRL